MTVVTPIKNTYTHYGNTYTPNIRSIKVCMKCSYTDDVIRGNKFYKISPDRFDSNQPIIM